MSDTDNFEQIVAAVQRQFFDLSSVRRITLTVPGYDVDAAFWQLQKEAAPFVNDESKKVTIRNMHRILYGSFENSIIELHERSDHLNARSLDHSERSRHSKQDLFEAYTCGSGSESGSCLVTGATFIVLSTRWSF
ncbi:unnamed protein product [Mortierella alpina]